MMDIRMNYSEKGSGRPLILIHGNGGSLKYFKKQIDCFSNEYRVIAVEQFAEDLKSFMDEKNIAKANLLGFSDGGNIGLAFALKHQEMIDRMVICGANIFPEGLKKSALAPRAAAYKLHRRISKNGKRTELLDLIINQPRINPTDLKKITVPVLVVAGTKDMIRADHTRLIYENLPHSKLLFIEGGHLLPNMRPRQFNDAVLRFFRDEGCRDEQDRE